MKVLLSAILFFTLGIQATEASSSFIIVNKETNQLAYFKEGEVVEIFTVATGATNDLTPTGKHKIVVKAVDPYYRKKNIPGGSPNNPLGSRWMGIDALDTDGRIYGIHGTNRPDSIGKSVSAGCIRMKNEEIEKLYSNIPIGTTVYITSSEEDFATIAKKLNAL
ncbi:L,D-transpeptidase [Aquibacillus salsiterrae]|uniref:L,D-transpeptidase n=1 Tax=Aquibacillus salsiterrae TaxID=2950439 RepID=A0A9X3WAU7_9BACI|nr:L,D-transpeptidase [Aquibacillus salsiterrae]MDC3415452.1 L,D-transpeptidase [Aquibacillus salsiterrae]